MKGLLRLLADNRGVRGDRRFEIKAAADEATVYLYDTIVANQIDTEWFGGVAADAFVKEIAALDVGTIHVRINSPGGDVFAGRAMETALRQHRAQVVVHIDGIAASAATFIAMAGDRVEIAAGAMMMVHKAWTFAMGNANDLMETAALLEKVDGTIAATYAQRTGMTAEEALALMDAESWLTAEEAVAQKFADAIAEPAPKAQVPWQLAALGRPSPAAAAPAAPAAPEHELQVEAELVAAPAALSIPVNQIFVVPPPAPRSIAA